VREAALDDPALTAQAGAVLGPAASDDRCDAQRPQEPPMLVVVIAAVSENMVGLLAWPAGLAGHRPAVKIFDQRQQLGDVVAVPAGQRHCERDAARVDQEMVL
jgi:hypothetical protein